MGTSASFVLIRGAHLSLEDVQSIADDLGLPVTWWSLLDGDSAFAQVVAVRGLGPARSPGRPPADLSWRWGGPHDPVLALARWLTGRVSDPVLLLAFSTRSSVSEVHLLRGGCSLEYDYADGASDHEEHAQRWLERFLDRGEPLLVERILDAENGDDWCPAGAIEVWPREA
ncbi:MAG: hypothetical protein ABMA64_24970 [Myxococcota bacterium]